MLKKEPIKLSQKDAIDYITFQLDALEVTLRKFGFHTTLYCMDLMRAIFEKEKQDKISIQ